MKDLTSDQRDELISQYSELVVDNMDMDSLVQYAQEQLANYFDNLSDSELKEDVDNLKYSIKESEVGYKNFCVVETYIKSIEWLYLAAKGHRRAYFNLNKKVLAKKWLIP